MKGENNFVLIYYKDKSNRSQPMYNITKIGALQWSFDVELENEICI